MGVKKKIMVMIEKYYHTNGNTIRLFQRHYSHNHGNKKIKKTLMPAREHFQPSIKNGS